MVTAILVQSPTCNAMLGSQIGSSCIFNDVTLGSIEVPCTTLVNGNITVGTFNCYLRSRNFGVRPVSDSSLEPAYQATPGWGLRPRTWQRQCLQTGASPGTVHTSTDPPRPGWINEMSTDKVGKPVVIRRERRDEGWPPENC